MAHGDMKPLLA